MAIGIIAILKVQSGKEAEAERVFNELQTQVAAQEPGNLFYRFFKNEAGDYVVLEAYSSKDALAAHSQSDHFKAAGKQMMALLDGAPNIQRMDAI